MEKKKTESTVKKNGTGRPTLSKRNPESEKRAVNDKRSRDSAEKGKKSGNNASGGGRVKRKPTPTENTRSGRGSRPAETGAEAAKKAAGSGRIYRKEKKKRRGKHDTKLDGDRNYGDSFNASEGLDAENLLRKEYSESYLHYKTPPPKAKEPLSPMKRKLKRILFYAVALIVLIAVCCVLSLTVFFKIDEITVEGTTRYPEEDIIASCMIETGDNLILCNTSTGENEIWKKYPYIETVKINKKLFNKIVIIVKEAVPTSVIESEGKYVLLSESGKIIDISDKKQAEVPMIMGAKLVTPKLSSSVKYKDPKVEEYIREILEAAEEHKIGELQSIDVSNLAKIMVETKNGLHIILGTPENIDYKMKTAKKIIEKDISSDDNGTLDVSLSSAEGGKSYFKSDKKGEQSSVPEASKPQSSVPESSAAQETSQSSDEQSSGEDSSDGASDDGAAADESSADD